MTGDEQCRTDQRRTVGESEHAPAPDARCPYCDLTFPTAEIRTLHVGRTHPDRLTATEAARFERALERESRRLRLLRLAAVLAVVLLYFALLFTYAIAT